MLLRVKNMTFRKPLADRVVAKMTVMARIGEAFLLRNALLEN